MAAQTNHDLSSLANRLDSAADGIVNHAANGLERDLRDASRFLRMHGQPPGMVNIPALVSELAKIANETTDTLTRERLKRLLGEA
jgi:hypothetical protein